MNTNITETTYQSNHNALLLEADPDMCAIDKYIHRARVFVCKSGCRTVGIAAVTPEDKNTVELKNIAVCQDMRGCGIGTQLVSHIKDRVCRAADHRWHIRQSSCYTSVL